MKRFAGRAPEQIGIVVADLEPAVEYHSRLFDVKPEDWIRQDNTPDTGMRDVHFRGAPGRCSERVALFGSGPQIELMQPLEGPSLQWEFLDSGRSGLHHIQYLVDDFEAAKAELESAGHACLQGGAGFLPDGSGVYGYFDTERELGYFLELVQLS